MGGLTPPPSSLGGCWCVFLFTSFAISISKFQLSTRMGQPGMSRILVGASMISLLIGDFYHPQEYVGLASSKTLKSQIWKAGVSSIFAAESTRLDQSDAMERSVSRSKNQADTNGAFMGDPHEIEVARAALPNCSCSAFSNHIG